MSRNIVNLVVFLVGLAAVCWIGAGYVTSNPLGLAVTLSIGACYVVGALELRRYQQATATLERAVAGLSGPPSSLAGWLDRLDAGLRHPVRLRIEGERVALPGPALTPYLVGLLVLLGMLGTLLGMVVTLRGTGIALESATDLEAMRASLSAPVRGLGFAFGTSIAGVATSAMLGLLSALCRRERLDAAQRLDVKIATTLRSYSQTHQREESFKLLQRQADVMPTLVERLQTMMTTLEQRSVTLNEQQIASQQAFHGKVEAAYTRLAGSLEQSLQASVAASARAAGAALQPVVEATMAGVARETAALHNTVSHAVQRQLDGLSAGFETTTTGVAKIWNDALDDQRRASDAHAEHLRAALDRFADTFEQRSAGLLDGVSTRLERSAGNVSAVWNDALMRQERASEKLASDNQQALAAAAATFEQHSASLLRTMSELQTDWHAQWAQRDEERLAGWTGSLEAIAAKLGSEWQQAGASSASHQQQICDALAQTARDISAQTQAHASKTIAEIDRLVQAAAEAPKAAANLQEQWAQRDEQRLAAWTGSLDAMAAKLSSEWQQAGASSASHQQQICDALAQTARDISAQTEAHASKTIAEIDRLVQAAAEAPKAAANLQEQWAQRDEQRLAAWTGSLDAIAAKLSSEWQQAGALTANRQQQICDALAQTAHDVSAQTQAHASETIAEIGRLVQAASEAPKAAADVVAELRQKLSDSMVRDTAMLEERSRLLATLETLLDAVNHASTEQRSAVDALVTTSADLLERVGNRFADQLEAESGKLGAIAAQVTGSALEVASLGDAFGGAVQLFGESNERLMAHLQRIEAALDKSLARSDEQLAYYVAQAKEVIDLSMLSQKQIVDDLQRLAGERASAGAEPA